MHRQVPQQRLLGFNSPFIEIVEQPKSCDIRFRYESEGRTAGSIRGENSTVANKTFPSIRIRNYHGAAVVVVSCVTKTAPHYPHPHSLVGKTSEYECKHGVCTYKVREASHAIQFPNLGIHCAKKKDLSNAMEERKKIRVDPFRTGYALNMRDVDLAAVRLCWQVFLPDETGKFTRILEPVVSNIIYDKKSMNDLGICRVDRTFGSVKGGDEVFLLCEKVNKGDIEVRFYEEDEKGKLLWEGSGRFGPTDVHHQVAIVFKTPPYTRGMMAPMENSREVKLHLRRPSTGECSNSVTFTFESHYEDPDCIEDRRKRKRPLALGAFAGDAVACSVTPVALDTLGMRQNADFVAKQTESAAGLLHLPATVLGIESAVPTVAAASAATQQSIHTALSKLVIHAREPQPFASNRVAAIEAAVQQPPAPPSSSSLPVLNSMELSAMGIITSQDVLNAIPDPTFYMASHASLEGVPALSDAGRMVTTQSQECSDAATRDGAVSFNAIGSFTASISAELDNLLPPAATTYIGSGEAVRAGSEAMSIISTSSLDILLNEIAASSSTPIQRQQEQQHQQTAPSFVNPSSQHNRR